MLEADLRNLLVTETGKDVFWDTTPDNYVVGDTGIVIILQQVGGKAQWYVEKDGPMPSHKHARVQVTTWGKSRAEVGPLARSIEDIIALSSFVSEPYGAPTAISEMDLKLFGAQQQFGLWFADP